MENSGGSSLKRQLPSKQIRRSSGGGRTADCSRGWSAKLSLMLFFLAYVSLGAYVFMLIEASASSSASHPFHQHTPPTEEIRTALSGTGLSTTSEPTAITTDNGAAGEDVTQMKELMTRQVLDKLWDITENLNILYKENWTRLAAGEIYRFHETMYLWMKKDCSNDRRKSQEMTAVGQATTAATPRAAGTAAGHNRQTTTAVKWNYPTAFLYALSVITTLGKWSLKGLIDILQPTTITTCNKTTFYHSHVYTIKLSQFRLCRCRHCAGNQSGYDTHTHTSK